MAVAPGAYSRLGYDPIKSFSCQSITSLPDTPTVAELGYPGFEAALWLGILAPAGTPKPIIDRLNKELVAITATPDFKAAMDRNGADAMSNAPEQFATSIKNEVGKYGTITKKLGIKLD
jgi:tripartite-type tricarboxylate transporter receptor subunit TctC